MPTVTLQFATAARYISVAFISSACRLPDFQFHVALLPYNIFLVTVFDVMIGQPHHITLAWFHLTMLA